MDAVNIFSKISAGFFFFLLFLLIENSTSNATYKEVKPTVFKFPRCSQHTVTSMRLIATRKRRRLITRTHTHTRTRTYTHALISIYSPKMIGKMAYGVMYTEWMIVVYARSSWIINEKSGNWVFSFSEEDSS